MKRLCYSLFILLAGTRLSAQNCSLICNGSFDNPFFTTTVGLINSMSCWSTTASDGKMEVWGTSSGVTPYQGAQFMELNATMAATMYQDFNVAGTIQLSVGFAHRGRAGVDTMEVSIGPVGGPYTSLGRYGDGNTAWGYYTASFTTSSAGMYRVRFTPVYWTGGNIAIGNFLDEVSVNAGATFSVNAASMMICQGSSATLTASGAASYVWTGGSGPASTSTYVVLPQASSVYTVTATSAAGCVGSQTVAVNVHSPSMTVVASPPVVCAGRSATITASVVNGSGFTWTPANTGSSVVVSPAATTAYSVSASSTSLTVQCPVSAGLQLTVNPSPTIGIAATKTLLCKNMDPPAVITATGGASYLWSNAATTATISSGANTATYVVTGISANGCQGTASIVVKVQICEGIGENSRDVFISLFPNPAAGAITVGSHSDQELVLFSSTGQLLKKLVLDSGNNRTIEIKDLAPGTYFLQSSLGVTRKVLIVE